MLDGDHYRTAELVNELMNNAYRQDVYNFFKSMNPDVSIVDTQKGVKAYCEDIIKSLLFDAWSFGEQNTDNPYGSFMHYWERNKADILRKLTRKHP